MRMAKQCPKCGTRSKKLYHQNGEYIVCDKCGYSHYPHGKEPK